MKQKNELEVIDYRRVGDEEVENHTRTEIRNTNEKPSVYLIYDIPDLSAIKEINKFLMKEGYHVKEPIFEGEVIDRRNKHENNLINADIILIYYGRENKLWLRTKLLDVLKSPGLGRTKPFPGSIVYALCDVKIPEEIVLNYRVAHICQDDDFSLKSLKEFLQKASKSNAAVTK